mmetsp:Transcript_12976/g.35866  ORF Transcript_12976/g.35866 Transcript_12976/m.35866 type:complete len:235 (-) Transcript_12976:407-1111(-)|eukprot:CAMPEP_0194486178 /NCGR_PEP_ID=MMETSP0253-20130528/6931_1 /TAXON_ID=2966 /ORGANISM="Noctiluca scintillans" /LENGTH=234 /DNA_ID=CAMNT_0039326241 /DNA_START=332 /DNA_END=1036 /DNA_ORIENTATION=+
MRQAVGGRSPQLRCSTLHQVQVASDEPPDTLATVTIPKKESSVRKFAVFPDPLAFFVRAHFHPKPTTLFCFSLLLHHVNTEAAGLFRARPDKLTVVNLPQLIHVFHTRLVAGVYEHRPATTCVQALSRFSRSDLKTSLDELRSEYLQRVLDTAAHEDEIEPKVARRTHHRGTETLPLQSEAARHVLTHGSHDFVSFWNNHGVARAWCRDFGVGFLQSLRTDTLFALLPHQLVVV